ncbi:hypothetical protein HHK36_029877 [Tetracentron sinense]|uniref:Pentatricopeptide repeat-containing protein n=1 Tax=Tetracentron sinense TaxID=13715 RepID=A0A834YFK1_TETSI|nr:hypothetical protein HHK36_029877 [Tetracentron sinense]
MIDWDDGGTTTGGVDEHVDLVSMGLVAVAGSKGAALGALSSEAGGKSCVCGCQRDDAIGGDEPVAAEDEPIDSSIFSNPRDIVREILRGLESFGVKKFVSSYHFQTLILSLSPSQVDQILYFLRGKDSESAVVFFNLMRNEYGFRHSRVSQFVICHIMARKRRLKELRQVLRQMLEEEGSVSAHSLCELLWTTFRGWDSNSLVWDMLANVYSRSEMIHDALVVLDKMKSLNFRASISTYDSLIYNLRHTDMIWGIYHDIIVSGIPQSKYTNTILIDGLCRQLRLQDAVKFFQETKGNDFRPCVVSLNILMSGFCKKGFVDVAKSFLCMMLKHGLLPDRYSYNTLIHGLCVAGCMEEALEFSDDMERHGVEPDVVTYNILVYGFRLLGLMSEALKVIHKMLLKGLSLDLVTYTILICGHCQRGNIEEGLKLREEMLSQGFQLSVVTYSVLLSSFCKSGRVDEAMALLYEMEAIGLGPDLIIYSIIIHGFCKQGEVQRAIKVCRDMSSRRIIPNSFTHSAILLGLCKKGMISEARAYFDTLTKSNMAVDIILYNIMIDGYVKHGNISEAVQLYEQIIKDKITPSIVTYNSLIHGFCKNKKLAEARQILDTLAVHGLVPNAVTYTTLMDACCEEGDIDGMLELLHEMELKAVAPTVVTYSIVIKGLCKQRRLRESIQLLYNMYAEGLTPDPITYNTLIQAENLCMEEQVKKFEETVRTYLLGNIKSTDELWVVGSALQCAAHKWLVGSQGQGLAAIAVVGCTNVVINPSSMENHRQGVVLGLDVTSASKTGGNMSSVIDRSGIQPEVCWELKQVEGGGRSVAGLEVQSPPRYSGRSLVDLGLWQIQLEPGVLRGDRCEQVEAEDDSG